MSRRTSGEEVWGEAVDGRNTRRDEQLELGTVSYD